MINNDEKASGSQGAVLSKSNVKIAWADNAGRFTKKWKKFGDDTTMHGLGRAINSTKIWKRIVWSVLLLAAAGIASRNLYMTCVDYLSYPVSTTVTLNTRSSLDFPAVTVCNLNSYRFNYLKEEIKNEISRNMENYNTTVSKQEEQFLILLNQYYDTTKLPTNITHSLKEMLIDCIFDLGTCDESDFVTVRNAKHGPCHTFNYNSSSQYYSFRAGSKNGLILEMDVQQDEYLPFTEAAGIKVYIHPPDEMPFPHETGIVIRPGVSTNIGMRKVNVERQIPPWGRCLTEAETDYDYLNMFRNPTLNGRVYGYSVMACEKTCYQLEVEFACECCDGDYLCFILENGEEAPNCNMTQKEVVKCVNQVKTDYLSGVLGCGDLCHPPCDETFYESTYSVAAWPSENYADSFNKKAEKARAERNLTRFDNSDQFGKNYVRLEVHYETLTEKSVVDSPAYNWNRLLSDLGGQMGLWMGFSLMTAVEFLELGWDLLFRHSDSTKC